MATTLLAMYNGALVRIGANTMHEPMEDTPEGQACRNFYANEFASMLTVAPWPFSYRKALLEPAYDTSTTTVLAAVPDPLALAWDARGEELWGLSFDGDIFEVDAENGTPEPALYNYGSIVIGIAHDGLYLFWFNAAELRVVDGAGNLIAIGEFGLDAGVTPVSMVWCSEDQAFYMIASDGKLYQVNRFTGAATAIGAHGIYGATAITWTGSTLYVASRAITGARSLYWVNRATAESGLVAPLRLTHVTGLAWTGTRGRLLFADTDTDQVVRVELDQTSESTALYLLPDDFLRTWTWDRYDTRTIAGRRRQGGQGQGQGQGGGFGGVASDTTVGLVQEGTKYIRDRNGRNEVELVYTGDTELEQTNSLFQQLLQVRLARLMAPRFANDPYLHRDLGMEEDRLLREAQDVILSQREPEGEPDINRIGRNEGGSDIFRQSFNEA